MHYMRYRRRGSYELCARPVDERFWALVDSSAGSEACWPWMGVRDSNGYGRFTLGGRFVRASRVAYAITHGEIPDGLHVLHACDNPPCCNPHHLRVGDRDQNMTEMLQRRRHARGTRLPQAKLTREDAESIRQRCQAGERQRAVAARFGVDASVVSRIVTGHAWTDLNRPRGKTGRLSSRL